MGWLRLVGSLILQVSFAACSLFYRAVVQKRPIILRSPLIVATSWQKKPTIETNTENTQDTCVSAALCAEI